MNLAERLRHDWKGDLRVLLADVRDSLVVCSPYITMRGVDFLLSHLHADQRYLLAKHGPLRTEELHPRVSAIHPDLCDDSFDRVINGRHFGKKWKHAVQSAQLRLKSRVQIAIIDGRWTLVSGITPGTRKLI
ncbi:MAG: hypothetical protein ACRD3C_06405 [Vicinamibacterales bacterium]